MAKQKSSAYINLSGKVKATVETWLQNFGGTGFDDVQNIPQPEEDQAKVKDFVWSLFNEAFTGRAKSFGLRLGSTGISGSNSQSSGSGTSPAEFWLNCRRLENGQHWDVWGHRFNKAGDEYKAELVDDEIGNQKRIKKAHLLGAWHNISIFPNINNINDILYWERVKTKYQSTLNTVVDQGLTEGTQFAMSYLNEEIDPNIPYADELLLDNEGCFISPGARGLEKKDNNWFFMHCYYLPRRYAIQKYGLDEKKVASVSQQQFFDKVVPQGDTVLKDQLQKVWNQDLPCIRLYLDDYTVEAIPFDILETDQEHGIMGEIRLPIEERLPEPTMQQNHRKHIEAHLQFIAERELYLNSKDDLTPQEAIEYETILKLVSAHIELHHELMDKYEQVTGLKVDTQRKYPYGRLVHWIGGEISTDEAVDLGFDWRCLFHKYSPEEKPKTVWGRGVPEVLWNTNRNLDIFLSRIADVALIHGNPKVYFNIEDRDLHKNPEIGLNNDPMEPGYYNGQPPTFRQASASQDNYQLYTAQKVNAEKQQGGNQVAYGESPTKQASNQLAETLIQQNQILVTGEPNQNLDLFVTSTMTTRLLLMRLYYKKPRVYNINGRIQVVNVSEVLSSVEQIGDDGNPEVLPVPYFQIEVKSGSNLANQWQSDLNMLVGMASQPLADGLPLVPREAVLDQLAERYPEFAVGGKYYVQSEALKIGLQVMAEQQKKAEEEQKLADQVKNKVIGKGISSITP